jgi:hypothetical protein
VLAVVEINSGDQIAAIVVFDADDFDAAIAELDGRYLAGEAATHAHTWSVIAQAYAAANRLDLEGYPTTPNWVTVDHRGESAFGVDEIFAYLRAGRAAEQDTTTYVEAVHRLNNNGAVITYAAHETSPEGFEAEWRGITVLTVEGALINRCEIFDEADLDAALAKFDQFSQPTPRLENKATRAFERFLSCFAARDWDSEAEILADNVCTDDRRRSANAGIRYGRDAEIEDSKAAAKVGFASLAPAVVATRGTHLMLSRTLVTGRDPDAIRIQVFHLVESDADE